MSPPERRVPANNVDREAFRDMCRKFAEREIKPRWQQADREAKFPREFYVALAKAGLVGLHIPESLGGADLGVTEEAIAIEEQAKANPNLAIVALIQGVAGSLLAEHGNEGHHAMVRENIAGERLLALAVTEPEAGSDVQNLKTTARRDGDDWVLDGIKSFITLGGDCDTMAVLARTDPSKGRHGMHFFAVDRNTPGVETSQIKTYANRPVPTYRVMLNNARVSESRRLKAGFGAIMEGFNRERVMVAARWLGHMQTALAWAMDYAKVRQQFGKPIGANQSIAFKLAQGHVDVEASRHLTYHAAARWDSGAPVKDIILDVSSAKLFVTQAVYRVTQDALHIGGGWGITEELPAMRMALDALVAPVTVGSYEIQLRVIAKQLGLPCD
ncbi:MAG TPA: acyl-CoA dehydrogenase family protein [Rubrivivax sp.]|nr:acyl-CoA dehydrogenase family protein [Rubrivivax sp.]